MRRTYIPLTADGRRQIHQIISGLCVVGLVDISLTQHIRNSHGQILCPGHIYLQTNQVTERIAVNNQRPGYRFQLLQKLVLLYLNLPSRSTIFKR